MESVNNEDRLYLILQRYTNTNFGQAQHHRVRNNGLTNFKKYGTEINLDMVVIHI